MMILIAEDDALIRLVVQKHIELLRPDAEVILVEHARAALSHCAGASLLITDVMMPGMDGIDLVRAVREAGHTFPIVVVSASPHHQAEALEAGATVFLSKSELFEMLPTLLPS
jgi:CheY-like chemotaxis protein